MRKFHFVIVAALVGAIVACLMVRTPDATAQSETPPPAEGAAPGVEVGAPPNDPVLNEELSKIQNEAQAPAPATTSEPETQLPKDSPKSSGVMKQAFKQSPAPKHQPASVKKKGAKHMKAKKPAGKDKKKKQKHA